MLVQADIHVRQQPEADLFGIDQGNVLFDEALFFEAADPAQAGAGRQGDAVGQFLVAEAPIPLQLSKNP